MKSFLSFSFMSLGYIEVIGWNRLGLKPREMLEVVADRDVSCAAAQSSAASPTTLTDMSVL